jgi:hypothetical protein
LLALRALAGRDAPIEEIAVRYADDPDLRASILCYALSLPPTLRYIVAEAARNDGDRHDVLRDLLVQYDQESDCDLKVILAIGHYEFMRSQKQPDGDVVSNLLMDARAVGPDLDVRRAAAFAGLVIAGGVGRFAEFRDDRGYLKISTGRLRAQSSSLCQLIVERWPELKNAFGGDFIDRFGHYNENANDTWELLAPHLGLSETAIHDFMVFCESTSLSLGQAGLSMLARERPKSQLLENHCWRIIQNGRSVGEPRVASAAIEAAHILRDHFGGRADIQARLIADFISRRLPDVRLIALALYDPENPVFNTTALTMEELRREYWDWPTAIYVATQTKPVTLFLDIFGKMLNRQRFHSWDMQERMNEVIIQRLARDPSAAPLLRQTLQRDATVNDWASLPRYFALSGQMDVATRAQCIAYLDTECARPGIPTVGFDAVANQKRSISHSLLDALAEPIGL